MTIINLVACVKEKLDHAAPARDLYVSPWFKKARAYCEQQDARWMILSAKHGLVHPSQVIEPYDEALHNMIAPNRKLWAAKVLHALLLDERGSIPVDDIDFVILAGRLYRDYLVPELRHYGATVIVPMIGMGIGDQMKWLDEKTKA